MYIPSPAEASLLVAGVAGFAPSNTSRSYLDLATTASNACKKLKELADKETDLERKLKILKAIKARKKLEKVYIEKYMKCEIWDPKPSF